MISCNEFILFYNGLFREVDRRFGKREVEKLWAFFAETFCNKLEDLVARKGLAGMHEYWTGTLAEEGGRYELTLRDDEFVLDMHSCPSVGKLANTHVEPYRDYCGHCPALYAPVIERYGFTVDYYLINPEKGECRLHVRAPGA